MGGNTGNIRGQRNQSSCNGYKTFGSILASDSGNGAGSARRIYNHYVRTNTLPEFYQQVFNLRYGQYKSRTEWFLSQYYF